MRGMQAVESGGTARIEHAATAIAAAAGVP
jgi:hypothetical protein